MGAKFKSKTHLLNTFFYFWRRFWGVWLQNFMLISNPLKSFKKMHKKVISKTSLTNKSKSEKVHIFVTFLLITIFGYTFQDFFNGFGISVKFCVFLYLFDFFNKIFFLVLLVGTFFKLWSQTRKKGSKNEKPFYINLS